MLSVTFRSRLKFKSRAGRAASHKNRKFFGFSITFSSLRSSRESYLALLLQSKEVLTRKASKRLFDSGVNAVIMSEPEVRDAAEAASLFQELLDSDQAQGGDNNDDDKNNGPSLEERQGQICQSLFQELLCYSGLDSSTIRDVLDAPSHQQIRDLTSILSVLLGDRVDTHALLPATQDESANQAVLDGSSAITLTLPALQSAQLLAVLLQMPGALGSGLVELEALQSLAALLRRWSVECSGREAKLLSSPLLQREDNQDTNRNTSSIMAASPTKSPPKKRSRRHAPRSSSTTARKNDDYISSDEEEEEDENEPQDDIIVTLAEPEDILKLGFAVARALFQVPAQKEFSSWSSEAQEALLDAVVTCYSTCASFSNPTLIQQATASLKQCLENIEHVPSRHAVAVVMLRGLLPVLRFKQTLPNGEKGKMAAQGFAIQTLDELIQCASAALQPKPAEFQTPSRRRRKSVGSTSATTPSASSTVATPKTGAKSARKKRLSLDGGITPVQSPALKGRRSSVGPGLTPVSTTSTELPKPRPVVSVFLGLLQKLTTSEGLERANIRNPTVEGLQKCLFRLPHLERSHFLRYLVKLCSSKVSAHRLVGCELIGSVLSQDWLVQEHGQDVGVLSKSSTTTPAVAMDTPASVDSSSEPESLPVALYKALQGRLLDRIGPVRTRAAASLEGALPNIQHRVQEDLLQSLRKRAMKDETANTRKAAIGALTKLLMLKQDWLSEREISALSDLTHDNSMLVRKAAAESLTNCLECFVETDHPLLDVLEESWSTCVLPMVLDDEAQCSTKAVNSFDRVVISPILENSAKANQSWRLLAHVGNRSGLQGASKGESMALQAALKHLAADDFSRIHVHLLERIARVAHQTLPNPRAVEAEASPEEEARLVGVWCLMDSLISQAKDVEDLADTLNDTAEGIDFMMSAWQTLSQYPLLKATLRSSLLVMSKLACGLDSETAKECSDSLQRQLQRFSLSPDVIGSAIAALTAVTTVQIGADKPTQVRSKCAMWIRVLFRFCEEEISKFVQDSTSSVDTLSQERQQRVVRALFMVGELSMVGFRADDDDREKKPQVENDPTDILRRLNERPSKHLEQVVQSILPHSLPGSNIATPETIRAHAFTVLGKLCLRDEALAKDSLNLFARELHPSLKNPSPSVQSNALLVLGDLCVRYTNMADRYLPVMASCLQAGTSDPETDILNTRSSESAIVRRHAVLLLSSLLLQDYIKWRGLLFHRFLVATSDEDEGVANLAETVLFGPLLVRYPKLFFNHFVESLFVLNRCTAHPIYVAAANMGDGGSGIAVGFEGINLRGDLGDARRRRMYDFLLSKMTDEEKIGVTARLAKEVLGGALNSEGDLGRVCQRNSSRETMGDKFDSAWNVLTDAFYILTHKSIRVGKIQEEDDMEDPNVPNPTRQVTVAKNRLLSKISRKHLIEIVLPILCNLKTLLQGSCSPLLKDLMSYLLQIFKNYKVEVKEFLASDPALLQEIEYDARQHAQSLVATANAAGA